MVVKSIDLEKCDGCGICAEDCPVDVYKMNPKTGKAYIANPQNCWECQLRNRLCPVGAIEVTEELTQKQYLPYKT